VPNGVRFGLIGDIYICMKHTSKLDLTNYYSYLDFINECNLKCYDSSLVLHRHHIIPTFICDVEEYRNYTVLLSVDDHITAHLKLADCFDDKTIERIGNIRSAQLLNKKSIRYIPELSEVYDSIRGKNNPAKRPEIRRKIVDGLRDYYNNNVNIKKGKSYEEIYGTRADEERLKRKKTTRTPSEYKEAAKKISKSLKGKMVGSKNGFAKKLKVNDVYYGSVVDACNILNTTKYKLYKHNKIEFL